MHIKTHITQHFFNWKKFDKKTKSKFKTQKKSKFGGLYSLKVRENKAKIDRFVYLGSSLYSQKQKQQLLHVTTLLETYRANLHQQIQQPAHE